VKGFDNFIVILESEGKQQLVYKHAISTIIPVKAVNILNSFETAETQPQL
jgi:host factor-I protein